ncbi:hypothetical protein MKX03_027293 [Papaver bracteatum]|nr:hypothetical protein MKX03_027293 [Papaver bracteatum]
MKTCKKSGTIDRKTIEKNRRIHMKALCFKLVSLITLKTSIVVHQKHSSNKSSTSSCSSYSTSTMTDTNLAGENFPLLEELHLIIPTVVTGLKKNFMLYELITILEEHGAKVVSANFATVNDKIYHTIHSQVNL